MEDRETARMRKCGGK